VARRYGAHGYDPLLPNMSAIFFAAGPDIRHGTIASVRNVDVAPTVARLLGVEPSSLVEGRALPLRAVNTSIYLRGAGATANPSTLFLDTAPPTGTAAKSKDAGAMKFAGGNRQVEIGTWQAAPFDFPDSFSVLRSLNGLHVSVGLKNSDDQGVNVDLLAEVYKNGEKIAEGLVRCITGLTRDPGRAKEVVIVPTLGSAPTFNGDTDKLSVKLLTRIGTNPDETKCPGGHASVMGLRAYFDAVGRASRLDAGLEEN
jgi:hypothetical protein